MICLRNMCVDTLHKGENDDNDDDDDDNNNNNNTMLVIYLRNAQVFPVHCTPSEISVNMSFVDTMTPFHIVRHF